MSYEFKEYTVRKVVIERVQVKFIDAKTFYHARVKCGIKKNLCCMRCKTSFKDYPGYAALAVVVKPIGAGNWVICEDCAHEFVNGGAERIPDRVKKICKTCKHWKWHKFDGVMFCSNNENRNWGKCSNQHESHPLWEPKEES